MTQKSAKDRKSEAQKAQIEAAEQEVEELSAEMEQAEQEMQEAGRKANARPNDREALDARRDAMARFNDCEAAARTLAVGLTRCGTSLRSWRVSREPDAGEDREPPGAGGDRGRDRGRADLEPRHSATVQHLRGRDPPLDINGAARVLGISSDAVRKRVDRGTLESGRDDRGHVFIWLDTDETPDQPRSESGSEALLFEKNERIEDLRRQLERYERMLEAEQESSRELRRIVAALTQRIPELEAPPRTAEDVPQQTPQEGQEAPEGPRQGSARSSRGRSTQRRTGAAEELVEEDLREREQMTEFLYAASGVVVGGVITLAVSAYFFQRSSKELQREAVRLRQLVTVLALYLQKDGLVKDVELDEEGNLKGWRQVIELPFEDYSGEVYAPEKITPQDPPPQSGETQEQSGPPEGSGRDG